jgi:peroxiredoxin
MSLTQLLKNHADQSAAKLPEAAKQLMSNAIDALSKSQLITKSLKTGDQFPEFTLPNAKGIEIDSKILLKEGPLVIAFYRGGWCPYCNIELKALQEALPELTAKGAQLIGISPEKPDNALSTVEKNNLEFEVLTDENNNLARSVSLVYQLPQELVDLYNKFGINLLESQGNSNSELPISATYVVNTSGTIIYDFVEADYKLRADPKAIIEVL